MTAGGKLSVVVVLGKLENEGLVVPGEVVLLAGNGYIGITLIAIAVSVRIDVLTLNLENIAAVVTLTVIVIVVMITFGRIITAATRTKYGNASKAHHQYEKQT